jgi:type II secretory pathway pseudopilin PulG
MSARANLSRKGERGFTLLELLVAAIAGLFVVMAAFMLSRSATRLLTSESRLGSAQQSLRMGVDRLRGDLERASFMTTANGLKDPDLCPVPPEASIKFIQGITYLYGGSATTAPKSVANGLNPDAIVLMGNFTSSDLYAVADIEDLGGGAAFKIYLQWGSGVGTASEAGAAVPAAARRLVNIGEAGTGLPAVSAVFNDYPKGRLVRLTNVKGSSQLLIMLVSGVSVGANGQPAIVVTNVQPPLSSANAPNKRCGYDGNGNQSTLNPVQVVKYQIKSLAGTGSPFAWAYPNDIPADTFKYDLVRTELNPTDGSEIDGSAEIVSEYAVDLKFAFSFDRSSPSTTGLWVNPDLEAFPFQETGSAPTAYAADVRANPTVAIPHRIRSVRYRLSTRSRDPDRTVALDDGGAGLARYSLDTNSFARVRTTLGEVVIRNQQGIRW